MIADLIQSADPLNVLQRSRMVLLAYVKTVTAFERHFLIKYIRF